MLEGLRETEKALKKRGIRMVIQHRSPEVGAVQMAKKSSLAIVDRGYLKVQKAWREDAAARMDCPLIQVESDVVVPVEETSPKEEYAAATIRSKIHRQMNRFLVPLKEYDPVIDSISLHFDSFPIDDLEKAVSKLRIDRSVKKTTTLHGGTEEAKKNLRDFLENKLDRYPELRNDPTLDYLSQMSPYLHFGQISPLYVALNVSGTPSPGKDAFLEEFIVRRELSMNFVHYNERYDSYDGLPEWARKTLKAHQKDKRPYLYTLEELERTETHDPYWNAAQKELVWKGKMHGYMRMYWGKKALEWSRSPEEGFRTVIYLNNKYELDGRDPNGFTGVAWCFGKHDRPWGERQIFGNVRYMNAGGLKRKFDADEYVRLMNRWAPKTP